MSVSVGDVPLVGRYERALMFEKIRRQLVRRKLVGFSSDYEADVLIPSFAKLKSSFSV